MNSYVLGRLRAGRIVALARRAWALPSVRKVIVIAALYVVMLNAVVRYVGRGDAHLCSVFWLPQKSYAVAALALHSLTHLWERHDDDPRALIAAAAREHGVPVSLALSIARAESGFRPHCISSTGAMGMMQLMPATAREHGVIDPFDPSQSALGASRLLRELLQHYRGDRTRAAAAYNAGRGRVPTRGPLTGIPPETQGYVRRVVANDRTPTGS